MIKGRYRIGNLKTYEEDIENLESVIEFLEKDLNKYNHELEVIKSQTKYLDHELYTNLNKLISIEVKYEKYEHVLGGDGRSTPWSETREGNVLYVYVSSNIYLTPKQIDIVKDYGKSLTKMSINKVKIKIKD